MAKLYFRYGVMGSSKTANALMVRLQLRGAGPGGPAGEARPGPAGRGPVRGLPGGAEPPVHLLLRPDGHDARRSCQPYACIIVDEAQFLTREEVRYLTDLVDDWNIPVICYGLRADFKGDLFPGSAELLASADIIEEVKTICWCGKKAPATPASTRTEKSSRRASRWCWGPTTGTSACAASTGKRAIWGRSNSPRVILTHRNGCVKEAASVRITPEDLEGRKGMICDLCPRRCHALRTPRAGGEGRCQMPETPVVARAALHMWPHPPHRGRGAGTVFWGVFWGVCFEKKIHHHEGEPPSRHLGSGQGVLFGLFSGQCLCQK